MGLRNGTLTRVDLAEKLRQQTGLPRAVCARLVDQIIDHICGGLERGENVKISGFGTFVLRDKGPRTGRNPKTGIEAAIKPHRIFTFRASEILRDRIVDGG